MAFIAKETIHVSSIRANRSPSPIAWSWVVMSAIAVEMSILALVSMTPALRCTMVCATWKIAMMKSKVWLTMIAAAADLNVHLKNMKVSMSCILFLSTIMLMSS